MLCSMKTNSARVTYAPCNIEVVKAVAVVVFTVIYSCSDHHPSSSKFLIYLDRILMTYVGKYYNANVHV